MKTRHLIILTLLGLSTSISSSAQTSVEFLSPETDTASQLPFSPAVRVGNTLYLSGQLGVDAETGELVAGGLQAQAKQTLENIRAVLETNGYGMQDVVKCTVMLADIAEWGAFNKIYTQYFKPPYPARSAFAASGLALGARVEVECIAALDQP